MIALIIFALAFSIICWNYINLYKKRQAKINFKNKLVWITGASSGIGKSLAIEMSNLGADLILSSRNTSELEEVKKLCCRTSQVTILPMDLSQPSQTQEQTKIFLDGLESKNKFVNIMVHNAGRSMRAQFLDFSYENHVEMTKLNYTTPYLMSQHIVRHMKKNPNQGQNVKQFVIISSVVKQTSPGFRCSYSGSKNAISAMFDSLRVETYDEGIKITQILPGFINTNADVNAYSPDAGQKHNKVDSDIQNGMSLVKFSDECCRSIFHEEIERVIAKDLSHHFVCFIRDFMPDFVFDQTYKFFVNSKKRFQGL